MKRIVYSMVFVVLSIFAINSYAASQASHMKSAASTNKEDVVNLYFFWSYDCPHCVAAHPFIDKLKAQYPWLKVHSYEISRSPENGQRFEKMARDHGKRTSFVPTFFVGDKMIVGYTSADSTGAEIQEAVLAAHKQ